MSKKDFRQNFDVSIADSLVAASRSTEGLPGFLGCSLTDIELKYLAPLSQGIVAADAGRPRFRIRSTCPP